MKIDLHIHTIGDNKRIINNEDLLFKLKENKVNLAAISEHNYFDNEKHNMLIKNNYGIKFISAIEIDVTFEKTINYKQIILYCQDLRYMQFLNNLEYPIKINDLLKTANSTTDKILLSFHFLKDEKRSFTLEEVIKIEKNINNYGLSNVKIMLEAPNLKRASTILDSKFHISAFSDVKDWSKYTKTVLPVNERNIDSLERYIMELVDNKINSSIETKDNKAYNLGNKFQNNSILVSRGLNIIFGSKGSGKTFLIDELSENNPNFRKIKFSSFNNIKNISKLLEKWINENENDSKIIDFRKTVNKMNIKSTFAYEARTSTDFNLETFKTNINNFNKNSKIIKLLEKMSIVVARESINLTEIKNRYKNYQKINSSLLLVAEILQKDNYEGAISMKEIVELIGKNINDWKKYGLIFRQKKFVNRFKDLITKKFKINDRPKIGLEDKSNDWLNIVNKNIEIFNCIIDSLNESKNYIKFIQSDILGEEYKLEIIRKKRDELKSKNSIKNFTISKDNNAYLFFNNMKSKNFDKIIQKYQIIEIKPSDIFDIDIISTFGSTIDYIPSTGQLDMLFLDVALSGNNKDILIDEFCNSLDSKYVYENLVEKMNKYNGRILASTHNPVISVIPNIRNYIYTERNNSNYKIFQSINYLNGSMKELNNEYENRNTKKMLINVIEGTKEAFKIRGDKYNEIK